MRTVAIAALAACASMASAQTNPKVTSETTNLILQAPAGDVKVRAGSGPDIVLNDLPSTIAASVAAATTTLQQSIASTDAATRTRLRNEMSLAIAQATQPIQAQMNGIPTAVLNQINPRVNAVSTAAATGLASASNMGRQLSTGLAAVSRQAQSTTASASTMTPRLSAAERAISAASQCALNGQQYNSTSRRCVGDGTLLGDADYESEWFTMRSNAGSWVYTFKELRHGLNADPEVVKVIAVYEGDGNLQGHAIECIGAQICDDDARNGCNEYGGFICAWDNNRIRLWIPEQSNGPRYGHTFMIQDGWGGGMFNFQTDGSQANPVMFKAYVWRKYRRDGGNPDYNSQLMMSSNNRQGTSYSQVTHNLRQVPERVLVTVQAVDGPNNGFKFPARGNAMVDDDNSKQYGGLVFAYNSQYVRLWAASGPQGRIISNWDGWGGERYAGASNRGRVQVRAWRNRVAPSYASPWVQLCSNCAPWGTSNERYNCNLQTTERSFKRFNHNTGHLPARVVVQLRPTRGANNGYMFEAVGAGNDDEHDDRSGSMFSYDANYVNVWAPTRNNARYDGRVLGVNDGWGHGRNNQREICGYARALVWAK